MRLITAVTVATSLLNYLVLSSPASSTHVLHEKREVHPPHWERRHRADPHQLIPVRIALRQRNLEHADEYIYDVADPRSPNYGKHWSAQKVASTFAPHPDTKNAVLDWLVESGVSRSRLSLSRGHNWMHFDGTVKEIERLFVTQYWHYQHIETGEYRLACDEYSLPRDLYEHIDFIMPTIQLEGLKSVSKLEHFRTPFPHGANLTSHDCSTLVTINCLRELYKIPVGNTSAKGNQLGIAEYRNWLHEPDLPIYFHNFTSPHIPAETVPEFIAIDGARRTSPNLSDFRSIHESALDVQTAYSIIYPQGVRLYQINEIHSSHSHRVKVDMIDSLLGALDESYCIPEGGNQSYLDDWDVQDPPQCGGAPMSNVLSISYGQDEELMSSLHLSRQCQEWMKLGLQGVSVLVSSGDDGVGKDMDKDAILGCIIDGHLSGTQCTNIYSPTFPASCHHVTTVGATRLKNFNISNGERASTTYGSGGGFSNVFGLPSYQALAVWHFLSRYAPKDGLQIYNNKGFARGYPDVAALGENIAIIIKGKTIPADGTSASAPIFASIVTLLNEARIALGKPPLGFLNPMLYQNPGAFNDVMIGSNPAKEDCKECKRICDKYGEDHGHCEGCWTECWDKGFSAAPGWDPVTGLGTPDFEKLRDVVLALP